MDLDTKVAKLTSLACLVPSTKEQADSATAGDVAKARDQLAGQIRARLEAKPEFTVVHIFEPNGRLTAAHAARYVIASRVVKECGGRYVVWVSDLGASEKLCFNRKKEMIDASARYGVEVLKALGVDAEFITGSEHTLGNHELFIKIVRNSIGLQLSDVRAVLPPAGKKEVVTASKLVAPCIQATELLDFGADLVLVPAPLVVQMSLLTKIQPEGAPVVIPLPHIMKLKGAKANPVRPDPKNTIFFEDDEKAMTSKFIGAFCNDTLVQNPVFQYLAYVVIPLLGKITIADKEYTNDNFELENDFAAMDKKALKQLLGATMESFVAPVRDQLAGPLKEAADAVASMASTVQE